MMTMNPEIKARWVSALRSGRYEQAKYRLRSDTGYCCLGVLCDVVAEDVAVDWLDEVDEEELEAIYTFDDEKSVLPPCVAKYAGLILLNPEVEMTEFSAALDCDVTSKRNLAELNDSGDYDFNAIADLIEAQL